MLETNFRKLLLLAVVGSLSIALGPHATTPARAKVRYDGHWWLSISKDEQSGFLNGYFDCYTYEYKGPAKFTRTPPDLARALVTRFYERNPSHLSDPVGRVFYSFRDLPGEKSPATGGQPITGRHGYYRGLYWGELYEGNTSGQLGFVEGYLNCHAVLNYNKGGIFSKPPSDYVALINRWYGIIPHNESYLLKRESLPIADVLFKFRDRAQPTRPRSK